MNKVKNYNASLIIGTGFDLEMEMMTSYSHFFRYLESSKFFEKNRGL